VWSITVRALISDFEEADMEGSLLLRQ